MPFNSPFFWYYMNQEPLKQIIITSPLKKKVNSIADFLILLMQHEASNITD